MLVLTRRLSETLIVTHPDGTKIKFTVLGVKGNQVRIGVDAPKEVTVDREEIHIRKEAGEPKPDFDTRGNR